MTVAYGTAETGGSQDHTGTQVRIAAYGPRAANVVGLTDQTDLFFTIRDALRLDADKPPPAAPGDRERQRHGGRDPQGQADRARHARHRARATPTSSSTAAAPWLTDNTKAPGSTNAGKKPTLVLDTRDYPNGKYQLKIDAVGIDGRTTEKLIGFTIANR